LSDPAITVVGATGQPVGSIRPDVPVEIHATFPAGAAVPKSVDVTVKTGAGDSATVTLTSKGDPNTLTSGPVQIGHGVAEGYGIGKGKLKRLDINNGEGVQVSAGSYGGTTVTWYPDDLQQQIGDCAQSLRGLDSYLTQAQISLLHAKNTPEVKAARNIAKQKSDLIHRVLEMLDNDEIWPRSKIYIAQVAIQNVLQPGPMDVLEVNREINSAIDRGKDEGTAIVWSGLFDLTKVFYEQYTSATGAAALWTVIFGQDIYGKDVDATGRLKAAADVSLNVLMVALPVLHMQSLTVSGTTARIPTARAPEIARPMEGVTPKGAPAGVRTNAREFGRSAEAAAHVNTVAEANDAIIQVRPTNQTALKWRAEGYPGKPMDVKAKTINELDVQLGARKEDVGLVWYKKPNQPVRTPEMSDQKWAEIQTRYNDRLQEFSDNATKMEHLVHDGQIRIDEHGLVIDTGICGGTGKPITGDYDLWRITRTDGSAFSPLEEELIVNQLRFGAYGAQHGAHTSWKIDPHAAVYKADPDLLRGHQKVDADIRAKHQFGGAKAEAVVEFGGTKRPPVTAYEGAHAPGTVTEPVVPEAGTPVRASGPVSRGRVAGGASVAAAVIGTGTGIIVTHGSSAPKPVAAVSTPSAEPSSAPAAVPSDSAPAAAIEAAPVLQPIKAVFRQSAFSTYYTENADAPPGATYEWSVKIPADPDCAQGFHPSKGRPARATWFHADVTNTPSGPCNHAGGLYGSTGHPGTVTVVVLTRHWECSANYDGTVTGVGDDPVPCLRR
jgi:hypothetical protein